YFETMKELAREKRALFGVQTAVFGLRELREIYKSEGVRIDKWKLPYKIRAIYMCAGATYSVAVQPQLPQAPKLFSLVHELKHHYCDQEALSSGKIQCGNYNANELIEVGAEVFAAEFIYPEAEFRAYAVSLVTGAWTPEDLVCFKRGCPAHISYTFI